MPISRETTPYGIPIDGWARVLDKIDALDLRVQGRFEGLDARLRGVEQACARIEQDNEAARSRVSRETKRADDEDQSLDARVRALENVRVHALETAFAETKGASKTLRVVLAIAAVLAGGTAGAGTSKAIDAIAESQP